MNQLLDNVSIVLVDTKTPGNIGAAARCMMNMGLSRLILVDPPKDKDQDARKLAAGAHEIIENAAVFPALAEALADQGFVIGTSRHAGRQRKNIRTPREMAEQVIPILAKNRVAIVFGNEVNGLENSALALCHEIVAIPASETFPSLNLSHAVMIIAYELFLASGAQVGKLSNELARSDDIEGFFVQLQQTLQTIGFLERDHPERLMFSLRQLFGRARMNSRDVSILRGVLSAVERANRSGKENP
ncbi:MAG: RNA methyltransferase [Nitrospirae bacterium]|nr:RNA methyltransferase [Nitrospirota bacterium]